MVSSLDIISILAPAWGASFGAGQYFYRVEISILAPAWGASKGGDGSTAEDMVFQFSPPRGGRPAAELGLVPLIS